MRIVSEEEFGLVLRQHLNDVRFQNFGVVTGPGRSGAIAAVYASHFLHIPFVPFGHMPHYGLGRLLIIDTAEQSGKTLRKASKKYAAIDHMVYSIYKEPPRVVFWYEGSKPETYKRTNVITQYPDEGNIF